jgi:hypothetical protein
VLGIHYGDMKRYNFSLISFLFKFWQTLIHFVDPKRDNIFLMSSVFKFWEFDVINILESKWSVVWAYMISKEKLPLLAVCPGEKDLGFCGGVAWWDHHRYWNISQNHAYSIPTIFHGFTLNEKKSHVGLTILFC